MKDQETIQRFIQLRSQGISFARIATELNVSRKWNPSSERARFNNTRVAGRILEEIPGRRSKPSPW